MPWTLEAAERNRRLLDDPWKPGDDRKGNEAQRDRDRILYSSAFRRLAEVTQVVSPTGSQVFHNRLTHPLKKDNASPNAVSTLSAVNSNRCSEARCRVMKVSSSARRRSASWYSFSFLIVLSSSTYGTRRTISFGVDARRERWKATAQFAGLPEEVVEKLDVVFYGDVDRAVARVVEL